MGGEEGMERLHEKERDQYIPLIQFLLNSCSVHCQPITPASHPNSRPYQRLLRKRRRKTRREGREGRKERREKGGISALARVNIDLSCAGVL